ncbi:hypothetical protein ACI01nite_17200 [Acetobacter cibinongensis]|uniref:Integral membrane protein n=1 Tax=Acetobacter cibinongensis TaxID=146475 RepID=A0A0D6N1H0_9PROT|nr:RcnB family protein [Acetobacter cibinongensis]GAN59371.1 hypothetical protein Abci_003_134 [Acetobacter cibinongensis]GBQ13560.1 hypothetical protein AA0482_0636 [Acetobacter cibinongensis NRIC 0482]GEL59118.1 hypothetical protein ACI01nite_17200 [Acetobacter cibinongensis]
MATFFNKLSAGFLVIALMLTAGAANAAPGPDRGGPGGPPDAHADRGPPALRQNFDQRRGGPEPQARNRGGWNGGERQRDWHRGERYDGGGYYVDNWHGYNGLYAPPNGYRWINYGGTFLLTAIATGVISNIIANQAQGYSGY